MEAKRWEVIPFADPEDGPVAVLIDAGVVSAAEASVLAAH